MKSNYKKLGPFIEEYDLRNKNHTNPLGLDSIKGISSIYKSFIKTKANLVGVSPNNYKVVQKGCFGFNPNTARMGDKIPIALNSFDYEVLVSSIYPTFKIKDDSLLLPEYLMMWFRRPEFDRYARYKSHGSAREIFDFQEMCDVELPIPSIEKQQQIVNEYNAVVNRIKLNEQLNQKLEETAQALYKHWFVDFEFPNEEGKPYKSSGGKMVYNEELDKEIPEGWGSAQMEDFIELHDSKRIPLSKDVREKMKGNYPYYGAASLMDYVNEYIFDGVYILLGEDGTVINADRSPVLQYVWGKFWVNNHAHIITGKDDLKQEYIYMLLRNTDVSGIITGGVQKKISQTNLKSLKTTKPDEIVIRSYCNKIKSLFKMIRINSDKIKLAQVLSDSLLTKMTRVEEVKTEIVWNININ